MSEKQSTKYPTRAGNIYDVSWPGDSKGGGGKPAIPMKKRAEFIEDVRGEGEGPALDTAALRKKWGKLIPADRTLTKWTKWAKELTPVPADA